MIQFDRIELSTYPSRPLDPIDFKAKQVHRIIKMPKKIKNFEISSTNFFTHFRFGSLRLIKLGSLTVYLKLWKYL